MTIKLSALEFLSEEDRNKLLIKFNDTEAIYPNEKTIQNLFEEQVEKTPNKIAIVFEEIELTYEELNSRANIVATVLQDKGVIRNEIVAILMDRSIDMIIGMLAILKSGGAYMPIDPTYPKDRIEYMLKDSQTKIVLTQSSNVLTKKTDITSVNIDEIDWESGNTVNLNIINRPQDIAYIIYTSGSTGEPKGVIIEHRNVVRLLFNDKNLFDFNETDVWTMFHSYCFDFSVWEMYGSLLFGGKLIVVPFSVTRDPNLFFELLVQKQVTILNQTPTAFYQLLDIKSVKGELNLRMVIFGGEKLKPSQLSKWKDNNPNVKLINMYGITETTVHVTYKELSISEIQNNISNVGKPLPTLKIYLLNDNMNLVPIGAEGEIYIGGEGVARGYLNRPELTSERFIPNPFQNGDRLYKSGDLAKWLPNGELEYLGRIDHQVKIKGFRIELHEIETCILQTNGIKDALVIVNKDSDGQESLCAYFVSDEKTSASKLREYIVNSLPDYMVPTYFIQIEQIPLTLNNKVNKDALPKPIIEVNQNKYIQPFSQKEKDLAEIWSKRLKVEKIGIRDNYFELGGDSIKAIPLISEINNKFNWHLQIADIYQFPTIEQICIHQEELIDSNLESLKNEILIDFNTTKNEILKNHNFTKEFPGTVEDIFPMSYIQQGMVFHYSKNLKKSLYHDQFLYRISDTEFDFNSFKIVIEKLVEKHSILRTSFNISDFEEPMQIVHSDILFNIMDIDIQKYENEVQVDIIQEYLLEDRKKPFYVYSAPLWRLYVFRISKECFVIGFIFHHAILDGWSVASLISELVNNYSSLKEGNKL